ncbi:MATE family efflux transporter, partial [Acinetobacter baumannii]
PFPRLGIAGSALASAIASYLSMAGLLVHVDARNLPRRLRGPERRWLVPARDELRYILTKGLPMGAQMLIISMAGIIMVGLANRQGATAS